MVRKYIIGTRSRHGKIASILMEQKTRGPGDKGIWMVKGTYVTEEGEKEQFTASVTTRGEVLMVNLASHDIGKKPPSNTLKKQS